MSPPTAFLFLLALGLWDLTEHGSAGFVGAETNRTSRHNLYFDRRYRVMASDPFGMASEDYFDHDRYAQFLREFSFKKLRQGERGLFLGGPEKVPETAGMAPFIIQRVQDHRRAADFPLAKHSVILAIDLDTDGIYATSVMQRTQVLPEAKPGRAEAVPQGLFSDGANVDLFEAPGVPKKLARYSVRVVVADEISQGRSVRIGPESLLSDDEAYAVSLSEQHHRRSLPYTPPLGDYPSFQPLQRISDPGITAVSIRSSGADRVLVSGEVGLDAERLIPAEFREDTKKADAIAGVIPLHVLVTGFGTGRPALFTLTVPAYEAPANMDSALNGARFEFDLLSSVALTPADLGEASSLYLFLFANEYFWGPGEIRVAK